MHQPGEFEIETYTGRFVDTSNPLPETITLEDVAHALANTCRYGGHSREFYSVAEHASLCARYAERTWDDPVIALACLHHDDAEAYLGDIPRPLKSQLGELYKRLTWKMDHAIALGIPLDPAVISELRSPEIHEADNWALMVEARELLSSRGEGWGGQACNWGVDIEVKGEPPYGWAFGLRPHAAKGLWLADHQRLVRDINDFSRRGM